jgi:kynurenine/2-aminoadipate aminotransferase
MQRLSKDYAKFLSKLSVRRQPSPIRELLPVAMQPGMISLAGGLPNGKGFPFKSCTFELNDGNTLRIDGREIEEALQYSPTEGVPSLQNWLLNHQVVRHGINPNDYSLLVTSGSQDGLTKAFEMLIDVDGGDSVLVETPLYTGTSAALRPMKCELLEVAIDGDGIIPEDLERVLKNNKGKKIKFLYTVPTGQNPSGATLTAERKKAIYKLACEYDFLILEDDPYYYLAFEGVLPTSFLSLDTEQRVIRFDSLSKVLSSGMRIGWCTAPHELAERMHLHLQTAALHASSLSQVVAYQLLKEWGMEGLNLHTLEIQAMYRSRRDAFVKAVDKHLNGLVEYTVPKAGMFLWLKLNGIDDTLAIIQKMKDYLILLVPGQAFSPNNQPSPYVRASFSVVSEPDMDIAMERLARALREYQK